VTYCKSLHGLDINVAGFEQSLTSAKLEDKPTMDELKKPCFPLQTDADKLLDKEPL